VESDRATRLARVTALAEQTFGDKAKADRWLRKPKRALGGATPLAYLLDEARAQDIEEMLWRIDGGFFA
jgi:putative toxin-antitoxin system antitoxin component (TIGR02293 family)